MGIWSARALFKILQVKKIQPVTLRRNPSGLFEVSYEVAEIGRPDLGHDLLDTQVRAFQQAAGTIDPKPSVIPARRGASFIFEEMVKT